MSPHAPSLRESLPPKGADPAWGGPAPDRMSATLNKTPQTLPQWLLHNAATRGGEVAQRHKRDGVWHEFSWTDVRDEVRALALGLRARGVRRARVQAGGAVQLLRHHPVRARVGHRGVPHAVCPRGGVLPGHRLPLRGVVRPVHRPAGRRCRRCASGSTRP